MTAALESIDLLRLLDKGRDSFLHLGISTPSDIAPFVEHEDLVVDGQWIKADDCEFFFSSVLQLRHIKLVSNWTYIAPGGHGLHAEGGIRLSIGRHHVNFGGSPTEDLSTLPKALRAFRKWGRVAQVSAGSEKDIYLVAISGHRRLEIRYEIKPIPRPSDFGIAYDIDYFIAALWVADASVLE